MKLDAAKSIVQPLVMITGDESALRRVALAQILEAAAIQPDDFDLQTFDGDTAPGEWIAAAGTAPFLADRRVVVVRHLLRCDLERAKGVSFMGLPASALLILVADDEAGDEDRQRRLKTARTGWEKVAKDAGGSILQCKANDADFSSLVKAETMSADKKITDRALAVLKEMCAGSASRALEEVPKLVAYVGTEPTIQESDVREVVVPGREWNVFKLVDSVVEGDVAEALRQLRILVGSPSKAEEAAFRNILPQMSRSLRLAWQARACLDAGVPPGSPEASATSLTKPNLAGEQDFVKGKAMRAAKRLHLSQIASMLALLSEADAKLKGILPAFTAMETLEQTVLKMADVARSRVGAA